MKQHIRRLQYLLHRRRHDQELAADLEFHREMSAGAGRPLAHTLLLREQARDAWGWTWIDRLAQDLRYAARVLRKSPGFTAAAVLMLALGIGVNVTAFGFFDLMFLLRPLPVRDPTSLLRFQRRAKEGGGDNFSYAEVAFYREHTKTLEAVFALNFGKLESQGGEERFNAHFVTANFFADLGASARLGRMLDVARDEAAGADPVVVLSENFWQRHYGADPAMVGKIILLNGRPATIVGVASRKFSGLGAGTPDLWVPIAQEPYFVAGSRLTDFSDSGVNVLMWGRLQPGLSPSAAENELRSLAAELHRQHPQDVWRDQTLPSEPGGYANRIRQEMMPVLGPAAALGLLILAVACGNLGSLLLARGVAREHEIAIRVAVGAGRVRLLRQLFTESLLLALLGAAAGMGLGYIALRALMVWNDVPSWYNTAPDWRLVVFAAGMGLLAAIFFGLTPAWQAARRRQRATVARRFLIGAQVAASCVLLIVAALLVRALDRAVFGDRGFDYEHAITIDPQFHGASASEARAYLDTLQARLRALPGVAAVSLVSNPPLGNRWTVGRTEIAGRRVELHYNQVSPQFFDTMRIPLLRGHNLAFGDPRAIIVSESLARLQWPGADPIGQTFRSGADSYTVAGVVRSARLVSPEDSDAVEIYRPVNDSIWPSMVVLVRTTGSPDALLPAVISLAKSVDPKLFPEVEWMKKAFERKVQGAEAAALAVGLLGVVALVLACAGIVGLVGYAVSQRTREIGIRMALGAHPANVLGVVLRQFSRPVAVGLIVGIAGASMLSQALRRLLYGVDNLDPIAYLAAMVVFVVTVSLAALLPARRALRVDPMRALRYE